MSLSFPTSLLEHTSFEPLIAKKARYGDKFLVQSEELSDAMLAALRAASHAVADKSGVRVLDAIIAARAGDTKKAIPRLTAAAEMFLAYFRQNLQDGWLYLQSVDGHLHPWLVTKVEVVEGQRNDRPRLVISLTANGRGETRGSSLGLKRRAMSFDADEVTRKRVSDVLERARAYIETPELRAHYNEGHEHYADVLAKGFAEQYVLTGTPLNYADGNNWRIPSRRDRCKVIHDLRNDEISSPAISAESALFASPDGDAANARLVADDGSPDEGIGPVPTHFDLRVFDLRTHDSLWVNAIDVERYQYDHTLAEKIVLPEDQRNLLDILTTDLTDFTGDVVEGKSTGNTILCKGIPGVGKTLTAEVFSEIIERPLYSIHSGNLGVSAEDVRKNLETTFERAKRWNAVLLLDEADVFVLERGDNIVQNAIVAEFLRTLEYFDGLLFMTTNRANQIDDAILSRAAAIIDYKVPDVAGIREVWKVQATQHDVDLEDSLLDDLVHGFVDITPRDVKMLLRLSLRVAKSRNVPLNTDIVSSCAMFRGLHFEAGARA